MRCGVQELKIAAPVCIYENPTWRICFDRLTRIVDEIYLRIDRSKASGEFVAEISAHPKVKRAVFTFDFEYVVYKEKLIRMLDDVRPDIVVALDHDEAFGDGILDEIGEFWASDKKAMMFNYNPCLSSDGEALPVYPSKPHMKVFKWQEGLSHVPYLGYDQVTQYANSAAMQWPARTKIDHYCMWTPEMRAAKTVEVKQRYGGF